MPKVKALKSLPYRLEPTHVQSFEAGRVYDLSPEHAKKVIDCGYCEEVKEENVIEPKKEEKKTEAKKAPKARNKKAKKYRNKKIK